MSLFACRRIDAVVAGGGPAGSATALCLARQGLAVVLVERSTYGTPRVGETFPPAMQGVLARLGLWDWFCAQGAVASPGMRCVWGADEPYERDFMFDPYGNGWHVDRARFDASLADAAAAEGVRVLRGAHVERVDKAPQGGWALNVVVEGRQERLEAQYLVDATGRRAALGRQLGARRMARDRMIGIYAFAAGPLVDATTLIEATEHGWWYSAALPEGRSVFGFMTEADLCAQANFGSTQGWRSQLEATTCTRERASGLAISPELSVQSANSSMLAPVGGPGWVAAGDAALAFDPLAGQGAYRALLTATDVVQALLSSRGDGRAMATYADAAAQAFERYLVIRSRHYAQERRWPESPFWARRSTAEVAVPL